MKDDQKTLDELTSVILAGDAWLREYGVITPVVHNNIIINLYMNFPKVKYVEYFMTDPKEEDDAKAIEVVLYLSFWGALFTNKTQLIEDAIALIREYLKDYKVSVRIKRYRPQIGGRNDV